MSAMKHHAEQSKPRDVWEGCITMETRDMGDHLRVFVTCTTHGHDMGSFPLSRLTEPNEKNGKRRVRWDGTCDHPEHRDGLERIPVVSDRHEP